MQSLIAFVALFLLVCSFPSTFLLQARPQQDYVANIRHYGVEEGLSHREVFDIHQDQDGFIWLATKYGLNRFDGQTFKWWTVEKNGLQSNEIHFLLEDGEGWLWAFGSTAWYSPADQQSLSLIHTRTGKVSSLSERFGDQVPFRQEDIVSYQSGQEGSLYFGTKDGRLYQYEPLSGFTQAAVFAQKPLHLLLCTEAGEIWAAVGPTYRQLDSLYHINASDSIEKKIGLPSNYHSIHLSKKDGPSTIFGTATPENGYLEMFGISHEGRYELLHNPVLAPFIKQINTFWNARFFHQPDTDFLWFKGESSLTVALQDKGLIYDFGEVDPALTQSTIHHIFFDRDGMIWISTGNGLYWIELRPNRFSRYLYINQSQYTLLDAFSTRGIGMTDRSLLINTYKGRIQIDRTNDQQQKLPYIHHVKNRGELGLLGYFPLALYQTQHALWFSDYSLIRRDLSTNQEDVFAWTPSVKDEQSIWCMYQDANQQMWLGTEKGMGYVDKEKKEIRYAEDLNAYAGEILKNSVINAIVEGNNDTVWLAATTGLYGWKPGKGIIGRWWPGGQGTYYLPHEHILHIHKDQQGILWLASGGGGLIRMSPHSPDRLRQFTIVDGLSHNFLYSVYEDDFKYLWISSDYGIIRFDKQGFHTKVFLPRDGISHHEFNRISHFQDSEGKLYFGGLNGVTAFDPADFHQSETVYHPPLRITGFQQFDSESNLLLDRTDSLERRQKIILQPGDRFFRLEFALLDYRNPDQLRYAWKIEGYEDQWNYISENFIRVSGLPSGTYTLHVKGQTADGQWSDQQLNFPLIVRKPFYQQWWFWLGVILIGLVSLYLFYKWRTRQLTLRQAELERLVKDRTHIIEEQAEELRQLDAMKSRFFANVSHELRTPLTLIMGPVESALKDRQLSNKTTTFLRLAQQNGHKLLKLVSEILDLSKMEAGKLTIQESPVVLLPYLRRLLSQFESHAQYQGIELAFLFQSDPYLQVLIDKTKFEIIFNNLLTNAFKFTPKRGKIQVTVSGNGSELVLKVKDNGVGIHPDDLPQIFDRFYQASTNSSSQGGTGIGLAVSQEYAHLFGGHISVASSRGQGSEFQFHFPQKEVLGAVEEAKFISDSIVEADVSPIPILQTNPTAKLLLVEDNHSLRQYISTILGETYEVQTATNGQEALEKLDGVDLIISDVMMPVMDGFQLLEQLKSHDSWRQIPIIMLTARAELQDKLKALRIGVDDYMLKPFSEEELKVRVENLLQNRQDRQAVEPEQSASANPTEYPDSQQAPENRLSEQDYLWLEKLELSTKELMHDLRFTIDDLAHQLGFSRRNLHRKIKQLTGLTPNKYLQEVRLQEARKLIETGEVKSVKAAAIHVGIKDARYFSQLFRQRFGKLPSTYLTA